MWRYFQNLIHACDRVLFEHPILRTFFSLFVMHLLHICYYTLISNSCFVKKTIPSIMCSKEAKTVMLLWIYIVKWIFRTFKQMLRIMIWCMIQNYKIKQPRRVLQNTWTFKKRIIIRIRKLRQHENMISTYVHSRKPLFRVLWFKNYPSNNFSLIFLNSKLFKNQWCRLSFFLSAWMQPKQ